MDQLFNSDIKSLRVADLKKIMAGKEWSAAGVTRKADLRDFIITQSYKETQDAGIAKLQSIKDQLSKQ